jgi:hypothetical protein
MTEELRFDSPPEQTSYSSDLHSSVRLHGVCLIKHGDTFAFACSMHVPYFSLSLSPPCPVKFGARTDLEFLHTEVCLIVWYTFM